MAKKYKFKIITMFSVAVLLIAGFIFYNLPNNLPNNLVKGSKGLNNKMLFTTLVYSRNNTIKFSFSLLYE